jgi:PAS domain S-box-containing protein
LEAAEQLVHMGTWEVDLGTGRIRWSDELFRIHGLEPGEIEPTIDLILELAHPEDRGSVSRMLRVILEAREASAGTDITIEHRVVRGDGSVRELRTHGRAEVDDRGQPTRWTGSALDLTELRLTERELEAHAAVGNALRHWTSSDEEGVVGLLRRLGTALYFSLGCVWAWDTDAGGLRCHAFWAASGVDEEAVKAATAGITLRPGQGLAGRAWESSEPVFSDDVGADPGFAGTGPRLSFQSGLAFAAIADDRPLAVLGYYTADRRVPSRRLIGTLGGIGRELGRFFSQHRSELGPSRLTDRELEVLRHAAQGNTGPAIAELLGVSPSTVKSHFENIYEKLGVGDRAAAVAEALRTGLIS